jgi:predicted kinase
MSADVSGVSVRQGTKEQTRLVLLCGLPASGKTSLARELADAYGAVRLNPDEWELALGVDPFDEGFQLRLEAAFWELTQRLLVLGTSVVLEWGFWARSERDEKREAARRLGVAVELRFLDAPYEELVRRVVARQTAGGIPITEGHMESYRRIFQPPTDEELSLYDPATEHGASGPDGISSRDIARH